MVWRLGLANIGLSQRFGLLLESGEMKCDTPWPQLIVCMVAARSKTHQRESFLRDVQTNLEHVPRMLCWQNACDIWGLWMVCSCISCHAEEAVLQWEWIQRAEKSEIWKVIRACCGDIVLLVQVDIQLFPCSCSYLEHAGNCSFPPNWLNLVISQLQSKKS